MMSESIKKVEHADFVALLAKDEFDAGLVYGKVGKNRSGEANVSIIFRVDFSKFKFISATKSANRDKQDSSTDSCQPSGFDGLTVF